MLVKEIDGIVVSGTSDTPTVVAVNEKVTMPDLDMKVTRTAALTEHAVTEKHVFELTVIGTADERINDALKKASVSLLVIQ